jgi:hypothetical protein
MPQPEIRASLMRLRSGRARANSRGLAQSLAFVTAAALFSACAATSAPSAQVAAPLAAVAQSVAQDTLAPGDSETGVGGRLAGFGARLRDQFFNSGTDPSEALNTFSLRNYYFHYKNNEFRDNVIFRTDAKVNERWALRADITLSTAYRNGRHEYGTGDTYLEAVYTPWKNAWAGLTVGAGAILPTASNSALGSGKLQVAPILIPIFYPLGNERLLTYVEFRDFISIADATHFNSISVAGDAPATGLDRPQINYLEIQPVVRYSLSRDWYLYTEPVFMTVNWENAEALSYRTAVRVGHMLTDRLGVWAQPEFPYGSNRTGNFNFKVSLFYKY